MKRKVFDRCLFCHRENPDVPPTTRVYGEYEATARFCAEDNSGASCAPYNAEERKKYKERWTELKKSVQEELDPGIKELVLRCRKAGLPTMFSCSGHKTRDGWIMFYDKEDAQRAQELLEREYGATLSPFKHARIGLAWMLNIPRGNIVGAIPRPPKTQSIRDAAHV